MAQTNNVPDWHDRLRELLVQYFSAGDMDEICFVLWRDTEVLRGENKRERAIDLIMLAARMGQIDVLIDRCKLMRPNVEEWDELKAAAHEEPLIAGKI